MTSTETAAAGTENRRIVHRVVFPTSSDTDSLPLYVDFGSAGERSVSVLEDEKGFFRGDTTSADSLAPRISNELHENVQSRYALSLTRGERISLGTYFNAFPASYWRRWTDVTEVRLSVTLDAEATVVVYRSNARGLSRQVTTLRGSGTLTTDLTLVPFGDGGWYWFDVIAQVGAVTLTEAYWDVAVPADHVPGTVSLGITTFNRPDYCVAQLKTLGSTKELNTVIDTIHVVDQGTQLVSEQEGFTEASQLLGSRLNLVRQGNLGGSGGFSRGMFETVKENKSKYVLILDDDIISETEGISRAVAFADLCRVPTLVGGHMFNMYEKSVIHSFGERVHEYSFFWGSVPGTNEAHDFSRHNLRDTPWLHKRTDVDFNGWWMCLIPVQVVRELGLALPVFIKWDDAEYGLRAKRAGYPTVSFPGAAVWHVPWTDKDDTIDWQAYFHQRNRWLAAMLYTRYDKGGSLPRLSFAADLKMLVSMRYSAVELRLRALEDLLEGPSHLHPGMLNTFAEVRKTRGEYVDAAVIKDPSAFPPPFESKPPKRGKEPHAPRGLVRGLAAAGKTVVRQLVPTHEKSKEQPQKNLAAFEAEWWRLGSIDSALVSTADGTGANFLTRDRDKFRSMFARSLNLHRRLLLEWPRLAAEYRAAHEQFTATEAWAPTFEASFTAPAQTGGKHAAR
ncbi:glycosyltransferase [Micrococcales bacterium 31B]|nr:glycosyltransferase [Micrococcales bacterium 31B]